MSAVALEMQRLRGASEPGEGRVRAASAAAVPQARRVGEQACTFSKQSHRRRQFAPGVVEQA
jgi:hypothetical protein